MDFTFKSSWCLQVSLKRYSVRGLMALSLILLSSSVFAANRVEAHEWLERMTSAMTMMSYQGTFVYSHGSSLETMRITHIVGDDGVHERLYSVNGTQREVIRDKQGVRCVLGGDKSIMLDRVISGAIFPVIPNNILASENSQYTFKTGGISRVAGQLAQKISITPVDEFRYGYEFYLDQFSGLLLKWVLYDSQRQPIAKLMFTDLNLGDEIQHDELLSTTPLEEFTRLEPNMPDEQLVSSASPEWVPSSLPPGFELTINSVQEKEGKNVFEHQVYSDGLASVSVYIENLDQDEKAAHGVSKLGTANAFSRNIGTKHVTVIGEVPTVTVLSIANAVIAPSAGQ
ncbi:MAG: sigma-E factor negative regulatory protein RseB [Lysobacterales bacterium]|jgi:sigma-E factor negative regulatory protein RseB